MAYPRTLQRMILLVLPAVYAFLVIWWITIFLRGLQDTPENYFFSLAYGLIPLFIGLVGFAIAYEWGGFKSTVGRAMFFLSAGQFAWGIGNLIFTYYQLVLHIAVPYPGPADAGYFLMYPLSAIGVFFFFKVTGAVAGLRSSAGKFSLLLLPVVIIAGSYYLLVAVARGGVTYDGDLLKFILDIGYPIGDIIIITFAAMIYWLSRNYLGGVFKKAILLILIGFGLAYIADFSFSYTTTLETFFTANWVDLIYTTAFFVIALGLTLLNPRSLNTGPKLEEPAHDLQ